MTRYEAFLDKDWRELGIANIIVIRVHGDGSADFGAFLVDLLCLGVKDAVSDFDIMEAELRDHLDLRLPPESREAIHPACAKKLIEGAIAYAKDLGFAPHRDYRKARRVLSGLDASMCPTVFTYGENGKPCYVRGASDDDKRVDLILNRLEARCGLDGFTFVDASDEDADDLAVRDELRDWLDAEAEDVPRFYHVSGLITGLLLCPQPVGPLQLYELIWSKEERVWEDAEEAQAFGDLLMQYWNHVNTLILDCIAPDAPPDAHPVDIIYEELFDETEEKAEDGMIIAAVSHEWATGFLRATQHQPAAWADALARPDLAPHWEVVRWWAGISQPDSLTKIEAAATATPPRTLTSSIATLARSLRQPVT